MTPPDEPVTRCTAPGVICHTLAGDLLMVSATLRFILQRFGAQTPLVCGTEPEHQEVFKNLGFERQHPVLFMNLERSLTGNRYPTCMDWTFDVDAAATALQGCDLLINLCEASGPAFDELAARLGVPSVGFHRSATQRVELSEDGGHHVDQYFNIARLFEPEAVRQNFCAFPHRADAHDIAATVRAELAGRDYVVIHADTKVDKMWPLAHWALLLARLWEAEPALPVVIVGFPAIALHLYGADPRLVDCRDIPLTAAYEIVAGAREFIGIDSCMLHAADLCRVPGVGIFTRAFPPAEFGFLHSRSRVLVGDNPPADVPVAAVFAAYQQVRQGGAPARGRDA